MILYFSATGNSLHVAARLARATGEAYADMAEALRTGRLRCRLRPDERLGIVTPVYFWGLPEAVATFLWLMDIEVVPPEAAKDTATGLVAEPAAMPPGWPHTTTAGWRARHRTVRHAQTDTSDEGGKGKDGQGMGTTSAAPMPYIYCVLTYGTSTGGAAAQIARAMGRHGWRLQGRFRVRMVDVWTPLFDLTDRARCLSRTRRAEAQIDRTARAVSRRAPSAGADPTALPRWLAALQYWLYRPMRRTARFHLAPSRCTGCGLCAARCPDRAITMRPAPGGEPHWTKPRCQLCLRCLHHCPAFAIQYGGHTAHHGQFVHPDEPRDERGRQAQGG